MFTTKRQRAKTNKTKIDVKHNDTRIKTTVHSRRSQAWPVNPSSHTHVPCIVAAEVKEVAMCEHMAYHCYDRRYKCHGRSELHARRTASRSHVPRLPHSARL